MSGGAATVRELVACLEDARAITLALVADLSPEQMLVPKLKIVNPPLWEIGHVAWFSEQWILRHARGQPPLLPDADRLYNSARVEHDTRWELNLPVIRMTFDYLAAVQERIIDALERREPNERERYFVWLSIFHEDMHNEAFAYTRQTLGYGWPVMPDAQSAMVGGAAVTAGAPQAAARQLVEVPGGIYRIGAEHGDGFTFDNEQWAHDVELAPFRIARHAVTMREFAEFVEAGGYRAREFWCEEGWRWRNAVGAEHPVYWEPRDGAWYYRHFDEWRPLAPRLPVVHVNWYEADAWCRWAGMRLPREAEWEAAASRAAAGGTTRGRYPWGGAPPNAERAHLDFRAAEPVAVDALPAGACAGGCEQFIGNVWEWTADDFLPYPGFAPGPYKEYSEPWFGDHKALRGGCWATRSRMIHARWRNFYTPDRRDVFAGFRACAR